MGWKLVNYPHYEEGSYEIVTNTSVGLYKKSTIVYGDNYVGLKNTSGSNYNSSREDPSIITRDAIVKNTTKAKVKYTISIDCPYTASHYVWNPRFQTLKGYYAGTDEDSGDTNYMVTASDASDSSSDRTYVNTVSGYNDKHVEFVADLDDTKEYYFRFYWMINSDEGVKADESMQFSDIELYVLQPTVFTYDTQGGTTISSESTNEETYTITNEIPTKDGYEFMCWNTNADYSGTSYSSGQSIEANEDITLYAIWKKKGTFTEEHPLSTSDLSKWTITHSSINISPNTGSASSSSALLTTGIKSTEDNSICFAADSNYNLVSYNRRVEFKYIADSFHFEVGDKATVKFKLKWNSSLTTRLRGWWQDGNGTGVYSRCGFVKHGESLPIDAANTGFVALHGATLDNELAEEFVEFTCSTMIAETGDYDFAVMPIFYKPSGSSSDFVVLKTWLSDVTITHEGYYGINRVALNGEVLMDITSTTATAQSILEGFKAFGADGKLLEGLAKAGIDIGIWKDMETGGFSITNATSSQAVTWKARATKPSLVVWVRTSFGISNRCLIGAMDGSYCISFAVPAMGDSSTVQSKGYYVMSKSQNNVTTTGATPRGVGGSYYLAGSYKWIAIWL